MKKMITAVIACATMFASNGALNPSPCVDCGGGIVEASECDVVVFKVTGSGKAVLAKDGYKTVGSMKIKKGALALVGAFCSSTGACCYDTGMFYATVKAGKRTILIAQEVTPSVWSLFGKNLQAVRTGRVKKGKKYDLDTALFIDGDGDVLTDDDNIEDFQFAAAAFGKFNVEISKGSKKSTSSCYEDVSCPECTPVYTPKKYSGWFVGKYACIGEEDCFLCDCANTDVFGGTWKASYMSKHTTLAKASALAGVKLDIDED